MKRLLTFLQTMSTLGYILLGIHTLTLIIMLLITLVPTILDLNKPSDYESATEVLPIVIMYVVDYPVSFVVMKGVDHLPTSSSIATILWTCSMLLVFGGMLWYVYGMIIQNAIRWSKRRNWL
jgi:hypothetical protein